VQPGLGRTDGDAQGAGHLWQRHPEQVMQGNDGTMPGIQPSESLVHELTVRQLARDV